MESIISSSSFSLDKDQGDPKATCENTARAMADSAIFIKQRHIFRADPTYGEGIAAALGLSLEEVLVAEDPAHPEWDDR